MMKKLIITLLLLITISASVFAVNDKDTAVAAKTKNLMSVKSKVVGLENALLHVTNENATKRLELNLAKIQNKTALKQLDNLEITEDKTEVMAKGFKKAKLFGFIPFNKETKYKVMQDGSLIKVKRFYDFMFSE